MGAEMFGGLASRGGGVVSVCSAHPLVIEAALLQAREDGGSALIEATCNQVNQDGGYTGMDPAGFRDFVHGIADRIELPRERVVLGGDHLGPNPWKHLASEVAMAKAEVMVTSYAQAGYEKLHLDASMGCAGEPAVLGDRQVAKRAAFLGTRAETSATRTPSLVVGTEVPTPGGAVETLDHLEPTSPEAVLSTWAVHREMFGALWERVIAIVVQPGVAFGHEQVVAYQPDRARALSATLARMPGLVFEAHSTDFQPALALRRLVADGFRILKVGPALTFALREALYGLDAIRGVLRPRTGSLQNAMERLMVETPVHWQSHYRGDDDHLRALRHYSYSDRIRYYWPDRHAVAATASLLSTLDDVRIPDTLVSQFLPRLYERVVASSTRWTPTELLLEAVRDVLRAYGRATSPAGGG